MADLIFYPYQVAEDLIDESGINPDEVYNENDGVTRAQLTVLSAASATLGTVKSSGKEDTTLKDNVYHTIHRLNASANKKNIDFAANIKNTLFNTVQFQVMNSFEDRTTKKEREETLIKWLPSSADEADPFHSLQYGKTMTMQAALDKGLGTRYGCQCGALILNASGDIVRSISPVRSRL